MVSKDETIPFSTQNHAIEIPIYTLQNKTSAHQKTVSMPTRFMKCQAKKAPTKPKASLLTQTAIRVKYSDFPTAKTQRLFTY